jgi:hypothetical protein
MKAGTPAFRSTGDLAPAGSRRQFLEQAGRISAGAAWSAAIAPAVLGSLALAGPARARAAVGSSDEAFWTAVQQPGAIVLIRHAHAPGIGDPEGFRLGACHTQRNLDERGREQARRLGVMFRERGVMVGAVFTSQWCRTRETAQLAFGAIAPGGVREEPAFNSFFGGQGDGARQTMAARAILRRWRGSGVFVGVTHQVNVQALSGVGLAPAECVVVRPAEGDAAWPVAARLAV